MQLSKEKHRALIDACNLLCEFVDANLPSCWEIKLSMGKGEATLELVDPSGEESFSDAADYGNSAIADMIEAAIEYENNRAR